MRQDGQITCPTSTTGGTPNSLITLQQSLASMSSSGGPPSVHSSNSNLDSNTGGLTPSHSIDEMHHMTFSEMY